VEAFLNDWEKVPEENEGTVGRSSAMIDFLKRLFDRLPIAPEKREVFNLPNTISMLRIGVIPVLFFLLLSPGKVMSLVIAILFIAAALTDLLDGYIARKYQIVTTMGKFLDPIADKLIVNTAMIMMIPISRIPAWIVAVIVIRDFAVDGIRNIASSNGIVIQASPLGKRKTLCQIFAVSALMIHYPFIGADAHVVGMVILYIALILTVVSGTEYFVKFYRTSIQKN
jgi:CDP-diacylglycerol--glycerol-3-phosphate 3-phosphatidyltransferase